MIWLLCYIISQCMFTWLVLNNEEFMNSKLGTVLSLVLMPGAVIASTLHEDDEY